MIRCAFVSHHTGYGGAELMLLTLLERLDRARVAPIVLTPGEGMLTEGARARGAEVRVVPVSRSLLGVSRGGAGSRLDALRAVAALPVASARLARAISACPRRRGRHQQRQGARLRQPGRAAGAPAGRLAHA